PDYWLRSGPSPNLQAKITLRSSYRDAAAYFLRYSDLVMAPEVGGEQHPDREKFEASHHHHHAQNDLRCPRQMGKIIHRPDLTNRRSDVADTGGRCTDGRGKIKATDRNTQGTDEKGHQIDKQEDKNMR